MTPRPFLRSIVPTLTALISFAVLGIAQGATFETSATGRIDAKLPPTGFDSIDLKTATNASNVLWVNIDVNSNLAGNGAWESATWLPVDGLRRAALMLGSDEVGVPVSGREITLRNLTLSDTDMDTQNVLIKFQPSSGSASLTLSNSSFTGQLVLSLTTTVPFALNAAGTSEINSWQGQLSATTTLTADGTLTINDSGNVNAVLPNERLYFNQENNTATVNGSLIVQDSNVLFGKSPVDPANGSTITINSSGNLTVTGFDSRIETDNVVVAGGTVALALNTYVTARNTLTLSNATVTADDGSQILSDILLAEGNSTVTVSSSLSVTNPEVVTTGILQVNKDAVLNVTSTNGGTMGLTDEVRYNNTGVGTIGQIHIQGNGTLLVSGAGDLNVNHGGILTTERSSPTNYSTVSIANNATMEVYTASKFTNNGSLDVDTGGVLTVSGNTTIAGNGDISFGILSSSTLRFDGSNAAQNSLTTSNSLSLDAFSRVEMTLDPTALRNDSITIGGDLIINSLATLSLSLVDDTALSLGTKFLLVDYSTLTGSFEGKADGSIFNLGLNAYQIDYDDSAYLPGSITLTTVVPEPGTTALLGLGALALLGYTLRRKA